MKFSLSSRYCNNNNNNNNNNNRFQRLGLLHQAILPSLLVPTTQYKPRWARMESTITPTCHLRHHSSKENAKETEKEKEKEKLVIIMGATGTGKSRLSIDLATRFPSFPTTEIINSDKIQLYRGLDITTNKIPILDRRGVPHHLLGVFDSHCGELSAADYRSIATSTISSILSRHSLPLLVGGSNSFIHALLSERFTSTNSNGFDSVSNELRYNCCFLWVDVSFGVLCEYLRHRVDNMLESGMFDELAEFYDQEDEADSDDVGIKKAIGVAEFGRYFRRGRDVEVDVDMKRETAAFEEAVEEIKEKTCELAKIQMVKIQRLRSAGWDLRRLDATEAFRAVLAKDTGKWAEVWERDVLEPSIKIVKCDLNLV